MIKNYDILEIEALKKLCFSIENEIHDEALVKHNLEFLLKFYSILNATLTASSDKLHFRARKLINCNSYNFSQELFAPPAHLTPVNRLNEANEPVMYLTNNMLSAFDEINIREQEHVQVMVYTSNKAFSPNVAFIGEVRKVFKTSQSSYSPEMTKFLFNKLEAFHRIGLSNFNSLIYTDSFLNHLLLDKEARQKNYIATKSLFKLIKNKHPHIDGIIYEGIASEGATNLMITTELANKYLNPHYSITLKIKKKHGFGLYDYEIIKKSHSISENGIIHWRGE